MKFDLLFDSGDRLLLSQEAIALSLTEPTGSPDDTAHHLIDLYLFGTTISLIHGFYQ
jgi:hypothetical protein